MNDIHMIGIGDDGASGLSLECTEWIQGADLLVGGDRHLAFFPEFTGERWTITGGLASLTEKIKTEQAGKKIVILASGDPLFYGIGSYLTQKLQRVKIHPHLSSIQLAFARAGVGWQDAELVSLHGKSSKGFMQRIHGKSKVAVLTDPENTPNFIASYLLGYDATEYKAFVAEHLGSPEEKTGWYELEEMREGIFSHLNVVLLLHKEGISVTNWSIGIDEDAFVQRKPDKGLITKREVRVLSLSEMRLHAGSVVWDIGTCTGSVAIEAALIAREGAVYAIEKNEGDLENAYQNARKFRTDITFVHGKAPAYLDEWPNPDAVFIGGSGGEMDEVLRIASERLRPQGRIVLNAATIESLYHASSIMASLGLKTRITLLQVSRSKPILDMTRFEGLNPIYIITAWRDGEDLS